MQEFKVGDRVQRNMDVCPHHGKVGTVLALSGNCYKVDLGDGLWDMWHMNRVLPTKLFIDWLHETLVDGGCTHSEARAAVRNCQEFRGAPRSFIQGYVSNKGQVWDLITSLFVWDESPEGFDYWLSVSLRVKPRVEVASA